jgi:para-aminobenzoate synthetase component 2
MRILVVDNYDSFVFNLVQYLGQLGTRAVVWRNDDPNLTGPEAITDLVKACADSRTPLLGVCLGHQAIGAAFGATVDRAPELLHGKTSVVHHSGSGVLAGLPDPFTATRYHSLTVLEDTIPDELEVTAHTDSGIVMAMRHRELPIHGVQFHPESVLTQGGHRMLANWLTVCGDAPQDSLVDTLEAEVAEALGA